MQTSIFIALLILIVVVTVKRKPVACVFDVTFTNQLKGLAILMVIFCYVGYFLTPDHTFLFPLSVAGGKGVDIFLFLSGFGLTVSALQSKIGIKDFYLKRLSKIFVPMWAVLILILVVDAVVLHKFYSVQTIAQSMAGFFPRADLYQDINSPLWYFTLILLYYLLFPLVFSRRWPILSVAVLLLTGYFLVGLKLPVSPGVLGFYRLHYMEFPIGMCCAVLSQLKFKLPPIPRTDAQFAKMITVIVTLYLFAYLAVNSGVGGDPLNEQLLSLAALGCLLVALLFIGVYSRFLTLMGVYSYEIYLIHWPLMSRYDFIYSRLPSSYATFLYLLLFIIFGVLLKYLVARLTKHGSPPSSTKN